MLREGVGEMKIGRNGRMEGSARVFAVAIGLLGATGCRACDKSAAVDAGMAQAADAGDLPPNVLATTVSISSKPFPISLVAAVQGRRVHERDPAKVLNLTVSVEAPNRDLLLFDIPWSDAALGDHGDVRLTYTTRAGAYVANSTASLVHFTRFEPGENGGFVCDATFEIAVTKPGAPPDTLMVKGSFTGLQVKVLPMLLQGNR